MHCYSRAGKVNYNMPVMRCYAQQDRDEFQLTGFFCCYIVATIANSVRVYVRVSITRSYTNLMHSDIILYQILRPGIHEPCIFVPVD